MVRSVLILVSALALHGCAPFGRAPAPAPTRDVTTVQASFDATWDAVIDHFAATNTPITTMEKASGFVATDRLQVSEREAPEWADCGITAWGYDVIARSAVYNVTVREAGAGSTLRVTIAFSAPDASYACQTTGVLEDELERAIVQRAIRSS